MLQSMEERALTYGGDIGWTSQALKVCVERRGTEKLRARPRRRDERPLVTGRVLPPGAASLVTHDVNLVWQQVQEHAGYTATGVSHHDADVIVALVRTRLLRKLASGEEAVPAEVALAYLSMWADTDEECVGVHWNDGTQVLRVVTKQSALWLHTPRDVSRVASTIPWVDHSDPGIASSYRDMNVIPSICSFTGGAALAVGAAATAAMGCGGFVNPRAKPTYDRGVLTLTTPRNQITVTRRPR